MYTKTTTTVIGSIVSGLVELEVSYHGTIIHAGLRFNSAFAAKAWIRQNEPDAMIVCKAGMFPEPGEELDIDFRTDVYVWLRSDESLELLTYDQMLEVCRQDACGEFTDPERIETWALGRMRLAEITPFVFLDTRPNVAPTRFFRKKLPC